MNTWSAGWIPVPAGPRRQSSSSVLILRPFISSETLVVTRRSEVPIRRRGGDMSVRVVSISLLCACLFGSSVGSAQDETAPESSPYLFGDLGRTKLSEQGFTINALAIHDAWTNTTGGRQRGAGIIGNLNLTLDIDTEKAGWWSGGRFLLYGIGIYGERPSTRVGDFQFTSSIDSFDTFEPYQAFYAHSFADDRVNMLVGLHDFSTEFSVLNYGSQLLNSSFLTPSTITQNPASFYPFTGLGTRVRARPTEETYIMVGAYDGKTTRLGRQRAVDLELSADDGLYTIGELGIESNPEGGPYAKLAVGSWYRTNEYVDPMGGEQDRNYGSYAVGEYQLTQECDDPKQGLGVFAQTGQADPTRNLNSWYWGAGLNYRVLIEGRDTDALMLGFNYARVGSAVRDAVGNLDSNEHVLELAYRAELKPYLFITPDVQWVGNPGMNPHNDDAVIVTIRTELAL